MRYKFRQLKKHLIKKPYRRRGYRIERFTLQGSYTTFEKYGEQRNIDFICKKLGLYQVGKPVFLMCITDFEPNLAGLYYLKEHGHEWRIMRTWDSFENKGKRQKNREYREMIKNQTEKINNIHIIFSEKW